MMGGGVRRTDGAGDGRAVGEAGCFQPAAEVGHQRVLAAIEMGAAADVEQQAVGRVAGYQRRVAQTPVGGCFEQCGVCLGVFRDRLDARMHGARLRQRDAGRKPQAFRRVVHGGKQLGIAALAVNDERSFVIPGRGRQPAGPESILRSRGYGFRARRFAASRNDR
jgi:hypothetical protein